MLGRIRCDRAGEQSDLGELRDDALQLSIAQSASVPRWADHVVWPVFERGPAPRTRNCAAWTAHATVNVLGSAPVINNSLQVELNLHSGLACSIWRVVSPGHDPDSRPEMKDSQVVFGESFGGHGRRWGRGQYCVAGTVYRCVA